ncbi:MAG: App1 family protein [Anaerolineales bacterium]
MANWQDLLHQFVHDIETRFDKVKYGLRDRLGGPGPIKILPYNGYGTQDVLYIKGRVLEEKGITRATEEDSLWDNLINTYRRIESDEIPFARLAVRFQDLEEEVECDEEGMFEVWLEPNHPLPTDQMWHEVEFELLEPLPEEQEHPARATGKVLVPPKSARYVVVSDIDDTVIRMEVGHLIQMMRELFLGNARTRLPFPGVAALYRAFHAGASGTERNPLLYVSSSPWNLYDLLVDFFNLHDIPVGPVLFLRNYGITEEEILPLDNRAYKLGAIRNMLDTYGDMPFILIGDSSQQDPEIYAEIVDEYPERVLGIYVRNVTRTPKRSGKIEDLAEQIIEAGSSLVLANDTVTMARHAVEQGWITEETLDEIRAEREQDEEPQDTLDELLQGESGAEEPSGPAVVLKKEAGEDVPEEEIEAALETGEGITEEPPAVIVEEDED